MLDVSIRLDISNLLSKLKEEERLAVLYITHDIASARYFAEETQVMYAGQTVEGGSSEEITQRPVHPYTQLLLSAAPDPDRLTGEGGWRVCPLVARSPAWCARRQAVASIHAVRMRCPSAASAFHREQSWEMGTGSTAFSMAKRAAQNRQATYPRRLRMAQDNYSLLTRHSSLGFSHGPQRE